MNGCHCNCAVAMLQPHCCTNKQSAGVPSNDPPPTVPSTQQSQCRTLALTWVCFKHSHFDLYAHTLCRREENRSRVYRSHISRDGSMTICVRSPLAALHICIDRVYSARFVRIVRTCMHFSCCKRDYHRLLTSCTKTRGYRRVFLSRNSMSINERR